jgi:hypothetical protein
MSLELKIKEAVERDGLCELTVRVSRYGHLSEALDEPAAWQAIAKYRDRVSGPWGVAIRATPGAAMLAALEAGARDAAPAQPAPPESVFG